MFDNMNYYERVYEVEYTWRYMDSEHYYSERRTFSKEIESNKFVLELKDSPNIEVTWCKQSCYQVWGK